MRYSQKALGEAFNALKVAKYTEEIIKGTRDILFKHVSKLDFCDDCKVKEKLMKLFTEENIAECEKCFKHECEQCEKIKE